HAWNQSIVSLTSVDSDSSGRFGPSVSAPDDRFRLEAVSIARPQWGHRLSAESGPSVGISTLRHQPSHSTPAIAPIASALTALPNDPSGTSRPDRLDPARTRAPNSTLERPGQNATDARGK